MLHILAITGPIFVLIGLGFAAAMSGLLSRPQLQGIGSFVVTFALPALLVNSVAGRPLHDVIHGPFLLAYGLGSLAAFAIGYVLYRRRYRESRDVASVCGLGMSASNTGFMGYPIALAALGAPATAAVALVMMVEILLMTPLTLALAESAGQQGRLRTVLAGIARRLLRNPLIIAMVAGLALSALQVELPGVFSRTLEMLASAAAPTALFVIGGSLYGLQARGLIADVGRISAGKLIAHPLMVAIAMLLAPPMDPAMRSAGILLASSPMFSIYPLLGQRYGMQGRCSAALLMATIASFFTISVVLAMLHLA